MKRYMTKRRINQRKKDHYFVLFLATLIGMTTMSVAYVQHTIPLDLLETPLAHAETTKAYHPEAYTIEEVKQIVSIVAKEEGISDRLMHFVAENESGYIWDNMNHTDPRGGALGTFQIILGWHPSVTVECAKDPWCAARYFAKKTKAGYCESLWTTCRNYYAQFNK